MKRNIVIAAFLVMGEIAASVAIIFAQSQGLIALPILDEALSLVGLGFIFISTLAYLVGESYRATFRKAVLVGDDGRAPPAAQPDPALALAPGETITLTRWRTGWGIFFLFSQTILPLIALLRLQSPGTTPANMNATIGAGILFLLGFVITIIMIVYAINTSRVIIIVDDAGLTIQRRMTRQRIAWGDITGFTVALTAETVSVTQSYTLLTDRASLAFRFNEYANGMLQRKRPFERVTGDPLLYMHQAQRVLATIAARSGQPLRVMPQLITWKPERAAPSEV